MSDATALVVSWRGDRMRERRSELGLSVSQVAGAVGVRDVTIDRWEAGQEPRGMQALARLERVLDVAIDDLFDVSDAT